jgi:hypothetical protein
LIIVGSLIVRASTSGRLKRLVAAFTARAVRRADQLSLHGDVNPAQQVNPTLDERRNGRFPGLLIMNGDRLPRNTIPSG